MAVYRPHGNADVNTDSPRAWATCDSCGFNYNLVNLTWQYQWAGTTLQNQGWLVCESCYDVPADFLRTIVIPPDPPPVFNPRPEPYTLDENQVRFTIDEEPRVTEDEEEYRVPDNSVNDADE